MKLKQTTRLAIIGLIIQILGLNILSFIGIGLMLPFFITLLNGTYSGEWSNDKENGKGTFTSVSKDIYEGEWVNDLKHGTCKYYYKRDNRWYFGKLNNDKGRLYDKSDRSWISFN